jgi:uncharacterized protein (TIGR03435 family)
LIDRFGFRAHHESRETTYFELAVAKNGPKLKPAAQEGMGSMGHRQDGIHAHFPKMTMEAFADILETKPRKSLRTLQD